MISPYTGTDFFLSEAAELVVLICRSLIDGAYLHFIPKAVVHLNVDPFPHFMAPDGLSQR